MPDRVGKKRNGDRVGIKQMRKKNNSIPLEGTMKDIINGKTSIVVPNFLKPEREVDYYREYVEKSGLVTPSYISERPSSGEVQGYSDCCGQSFRSQYWHFHHYHHSPRWRSHSPSDFEHLDVP